MAYLYADENLALPIVEALRDLGHDVVTMMERGFANRRVPDEEVLRLATAEGRAVLTFNRKHFIRLHRANPAHAGIVICTVDPDMEALAARIHASLETFDSLKGQLIRVNRP